MNWEYQIEWIHFIRTVFSSNKFDRVQRRLESNYLYKKN